jgi:hypothetical protein
MQTDILIPCLPVNIPASLIWDITTSQRRFSSFLQPPKPSVKFQLGYFPKKERSFIKAQNVVAD